MRLHLTALVLALASAGCAQVPTVADISPGALRSHVSFLSSDLLEGRGTPSRGQDLAAEYIAAQFRGAGLEPAGDDGYYQTANWQYAERKADEVALTVTAGGKAIVVPAGGAPGGAGPG